MLEALPPLAWNAFWVAQGLIGIAMISDFVSFQCKARKQILVFLIISALLISIHFYLLEQYLAMAVGLVSAARFIVSYISTKEYWLFLFLALLGVVSFATYQTPVGLIAVLASILVTIGSFQSSDRTLRLWIMSGTTCWVIHNALVFSPMATLMEMIFLGSNLIGYYRFYGWKK